MVVNFKARGISRCACKLARTSMLKKKMIHIFCQKKKKNNICFVLNLIYLGSRYVYCKSSNP
jgi:hypothetical protein